MKTALGSVESKDWWWRIMWRINVLNGGIGRTGFRVSVKPAKEVQPVNAVPSVTETSPERTATNTIYGQPDRDLCSPRHSIRPINFYCRAPQAISVQLAGDFNQWNPLPMQRHDDGWWFVQVMLIHGHHQYHFLVHGKPVLDPRAMGKGRNQSNEEVSVVAVG